MLVVRRALASGVVGLNCRPGAPVELEPQPLVTATAAASAGIAAGTPRFREQAEENEDFS